MQQLYWSLEVALTVIVSLWIMQNLVPGYYLSIARLVVDKIPLPGTVAVFLLPLAIGLACERLGMAPAECVAIGVSLGALIRVSPGFGHLRFVRKDRRNAYRALLVVFVVAYYGLASLGYHLTGWLEGTVASNLLAVLARNLGQFLHDMIISVIATAVVVWLGPRLGYEYVSGDQRVGSHSKKGTSSGRSRKRASARPS